MKEKVHNLFKEEPDICADANTDLKRNEKCKNEEDRM